MNTRHATAGDASQPGRRRIALSAVVLALGVMIVAAVGGIVWFFTGDTPDAVDIVNAVDQAGDAASVDAAQATAADSDTWNVDTSIGEFSITDSTGTFVGVRVDEELSRIGANTAVIRTPDVDGSITLDDTTLTAATIVADFTALVTDESRRDDAVQRALNTAEHPDATFVLTAPVELGAVPVAGEPIEATATGDLTINDVTNTVDVPLQVALTDAGVAVVTGSFDVELADYDVTPPTAPIVVSVAGTGTVELQLFFTRT